MKSVALVLLCAGLFLGCRTTRQPEPVEPGKGFRLLTYNINWGGAGADQVAALVRDSQADILCFQETTPQWEKYLRNQLAAEFPFVAFGESEGRMSGGLAFVSKVPAREVAYIVPTLVGSTVGSSSSKRSLVPCRC